MMSLVACPGRTWVTRMAVCTHVITGNILNKVLQSLLVPRLLALAHDTRHWRQDEWMEASAAFPVNIVLY